MLSESPSFEGWLILLSLFNLLLLKALKLSHSAMIIGASMTKPFYGNNYYILIIYFFGFLNVIVWFVYVFVHFVFDLYLMHLECDLFYFIYLWDT